MKVTWKPPIEQSINSVLINLNKEDLLPQFKKQYSKDMSYNDVWKQYDKEIKKHYQSALKKPFYYYQQQQYKKQKQVAKLANRLKNRQQCVDYFSWEGTKLFFKDQEMDPNPEEDYNQNPFFIFNRFDRKAFISQNFDNMLQSYAQMDMDKVKLIKSRQILEARKHHTQPSRKDSKSIVRKKPNYQIKVSKISQKSYALHRNNTINYTKSPTLNINRKSSNRSTIGGQVLDFQKSWRINQISKISLEINESKLLQRLKQMSENTIATKSSVRVYRQQMRTVVIDRYGFDNLTGFLSIDSILGYQEVQELIKRILDMDEQSIIFMCFNVLDSDQDGHISDDDIFNLIKYSKDNILLETDYLKIARYFLENKNQHLSQPSSTDLFTSQPTYISFLGKRTSKTKELKPIQNPPKFFHMLQAFEKNKQSGRKKRKQSRRFQKVSQQTQTHSLKYQTYKDIFKHSVPLLYYDILYVLAGIQKPNLIYQPLKQPYTQLPKTETDIEPDNIIKKSRFYRIRTNMREAASTLPKIFI